MKIKVKVDVDVDGKVFSIDGSYGYLGESGVIEQVLADIKAKLDIIYGSPSFKKLEDVTVKKDKSIGIRKED